MLKSKKKKPITITKVQNAFNEAIRNRDQRCTIEHGQCAGNLECSHFYPVGGNGSIRFYPGNAYAQCSSAHTSHHNRDPLLYMQWMKSHHYDDLEWMQSVRGKAQVRYNQPTLQLIYSLCKDGDLATLKSYIEDLNGGRFGD